MIRAGEIAKGTFLLIKNDPCEVVEREFVNPGKGSALGDTSLARRHIVADPATLQHEPVLISMVVSGLQSSAKDREHHSRRKQDDLCTTVHGTDPNTGKRTPASSFRRPEIGRASCRERV